MSPTYRAETHLYHALPATGTIAISEVGPAGPWTELTLSESLPVTEALADWASQATAHGDLAGAYSLGWIPSPQRRIYAGVTGNYPDIETPTTAYSEGFEAALNWTSSPASGYAFFRHTGNTTSSGTGPTSGAYAGSYYAYVEASSGASGAIAYLTSPVIDLTNYSSATFTCRYHMYNSLSSTLEMGDWGLQVETAVVGWTELEAVTGPLTDTWNAYSRDLSAYCGQAIRLRIRATKGTSGSTFRGDKCFDQISVDGDLVTPGDPVEAWIKVSPTLRDLLGLSTTKQDLPAYGIGGGYALGIVELDGLSFTPPAYSAQTELFEYRAGRLDSYHHSRVETTEVTAEISETDWTLLEASPILRSGKVRVCCGDPDNAWDPDHLDGYLDVTPIPESVELEQIEGAPEGVVQPLIKLHNELG